jgi:hypothetical protein
MAKQQKAKQEAQEEARQDATEQVAASPNAEATEDTEDSDRVKNSRKGVTEEDVRVYTSLADARANQPEGKENWELWQLTTPDSIARWTWAPYYDRAIRQVVEEDGWNVATVDSLPTQDEVAAQRAALSPEDRAALLAKFMPSKK